MARGPRAVGSLLWAIRAKGRSIWSASHHCVAFQASCASIPFPWDSCRPAPARRRSWSGLAALTAARLGRLADHGGRAVELPSSTHSHPPHRAPTGPLARLACSHVPVPVPEAGRPSCAQSTLRSPLAAHSTASAVYIWGPCTYRPWLHTSIPGCHGDQALSPVGI